MKKIALLTLAVVLISGSILNAQRGQRNMAANDDSQYRNCMIPDLTDDQEKKVTDLRNAHWKEMAEYRADLDIARAELHKLRVVDNPDAKMIDAKIEKMGSIKTQMHKASSNHQLAVRELLTTDQKIWYDNKGMRRGGKGHFGGGRGNRHGSGCGYNQGRGNGQGNGHGRGNGMGMRDGSCPRN
ncbi:MAG: periplasmic heavy metal sensor [Salinivirgaceae bacterium]|jgi:Spy/CpxP family protein refolding chaperone|nr:periplasmic heavy metal sensor [Salinivirgaceae bacterium]